MTEEELIEYVKTELGVSESDVSKYLTDYYKLRAYATGAITLKEAKHFSTEIQLEALELGADANNAKKFTSEMQLDAFQSGLFTAKESLKIKSPSEVRNNDVADILLGNGVFTTQIQADSYSSGKIRIKDAQLFTKQCQVDALGSALVSTAEQALKFTDPIKLAALNTGEVDAASASQFSKYYTINLFNKVSTDEVSDLVDVNVYGYLILKDSPENITVIEAKKLNTWYKHHAFMSGKVNASTAALFDGPKYQMLQHSDLEDVDQIIRFSNYNQTQAYRTGKLTVDEAVSITNKCQMLAVRLLSDPNIGDITSLSKKCSFEQASDQCHVIDTNDESANVTGDCDANNLWVLNVTV
ncbi:MAG: hypothetical protein RLN62_05565 [Rickettsiales bacterium]